MSKAIVLFGELMLRLNPEGFSRLVQADRLQVYYTGGEANTGAALVHWGRDVRMVSRVPTHEVGQACINYLRRFGLDTRYIQRGGDRLGLFYLEAGASQRQSKIIYDRKDSAFTTFSDEHLDWDEVFAGAGWFHFAGTAPAVSTSLLPVLQRACAAARRHGLTVSCDLNYRSKLWSREAAAQTMGDLLKQVDVFVCGVDDARSIFDLEISADQAPRDAAESVAQQFFSRFGFSHVAVPLRESLSATMNRYGAMLATPAGAAFSALHEIPFIVDRVGAGDAMTAGLVHGISAGWTTAKTIEFAVAASCLKHSIPGDFNLVSLEEVQSLVAGDGSGRIQR